MSKHLQRDLELIESELLALSSMTEEMIDKACVALMRRQLDIAADVIKFDAKVDEREVKIEDDCLKVLALHQPVASDLRRTAAILKINNDLERIADLAVNIAEAAERLIFFPGLVVPEDLGTMAKHARAMVRESLDSFVHLDAERARLACQSDDTIDDLHAYVITKIQDMVHRKPETVEFAFVLYSAAHQFERIADHATNIAEDVIYLVEGEIARHKPNQRL